MCFCVFWVTSLELDESGEGTTKDHRSMAAKVDRGAAQGGTQRPPGGTPRHSRETQQIRKNKKHKNSRIRREWRRYHERSSQDSNVWETQKTHSKSVDLFCFLREQSWIRREWRRYHERLPQHGSKSWWPKVGQQKGGVAPPISLRRRMKSFHKKLLNRLHETP